jgi:flagella basal body P-ring formation protein FlgA
VTIGDLAKTIVGGSEAERQTLRSVPVMEVPPPGESLRCSSTRVLAAARMGGVKEFGRLRFDGPSTFDVYGLGQTITKEHLVEKVTEDIIRDFEWDPQELSIRILSFPDKIRVPPGEIQLRVYRTSPSRYGSVQYDVTVLINGEEFMHRGVIVSITHRRNVFVFRRNKEAGSIVTLQDVDTQTRYIRSEREDQYTIFDPRELAGRKLARSVNRGITATRDLFVRTYLMTRGQVVNMVVRSGAIRMDVRGRAMQNGNIGDTITVRNLFNNNTVRGRIVDAGTVEML